jgi:hypothetical protein
MTCFTLGLLKYNLQKHQGFCEAFIQNPLAQQSNIELSARILERLNQNFYYLESKSEFYIFESEDKSLILKLVSSQKFLDKGLLNPSKKSILKAMLKLQNDLILKKQKLTDNELYGFKFGYSSCLPLLSIIDPQGFKRTIKLDAAEFVIEPTASFYNNNHENSF